MTFFEKDGTTYSLNRLGDDQYRFAMQTSRATGASQLLTKDETEEMIRGLYNAFKAPPEKKDSSRAQAISDALRAYAAERQQSIEVVDKEIASSQVLVAGKKRAMTREEWLKDKLGEEDLEEVIAGKMTVSEALANNEEEPDELEEVEEEVEEEAQ